MTVPRFVLRTGWVFHRALWLVSGHRIGTAPASGDGVGTLFLLSTGRRSGAVRRNGLYYVEDGGSFAVVASNAGSEADPQWWLNLQATPEGSVEIGRRTIAIRARQATADEDARLWPQFVASYPILAGYRSRATRPIPLVVLQPAP